MLPSAVGRHSAGIARPLDRRSPTCSSPAPQGLSSGRCVADQQMVEAVSGRGPASFPDPARRRSNGGRRSCGRARNRRSPVGCAGVHFWVARKGSFGKLAVSVR